MRPLQDAFRSQDYPDLLVGLGAPDDAAVWRLDQQRALVVTTDFFTPIVDDPYAYGAIAAANALSDLYAMGATPFLALNVANIPPDLPAEIVQEIFRGGADKVREAGAVIAGGHTVQDREPKYGLVALGLVRQDELMTKGGARPGDVLWLTKPLGMGVTTTALKRGEASDEDVADAVRWMTRLNREAAAAAVAAGVRGATDVTGYSLLGHAVEMANSSSARLKLHLPQIPFLRGARRYGDRGCFPGGSADNQLFFREHVDMDGAIDETTRWLLFDAQTSGGLLIAVPRSSLAGFVARCDALQVAAWPVGEVIMGRGVEVSETSLADMLPSAAARAARVVYWAGGHASETRGE